MSMSDPTLTCLRDHIAERGYPPSVKELAACLGVGVATAHARLKDLEGQGLIVRTAGIPRAIRLVLDDET